MARYCYGRNAVVRAADELAPAFSAYPHTTYVWPSTRNFVIGPMTPKS
jgi:hypothetical protein